MTLENKIYNIIEDWCKECEIYDQLIAPDLKLLARTIQNAFINYIEDYLRSLK